MHQNLKGGTTTSEYNLLKAWLGFGINCLQLLQNCVNMPRKVFNCSIYTKHFLVIIVSISNNVL